MKFVQENLFEFEDAKFFNSLNEAEEKEELTPAEKKKKKEELQKKGMAVVQKCIKNFNSFKKAAGDIWQEYRDFWSSQENADESVQQEGMFYNLWNSDYIVGVVKEPDGTAALKVYNTSAKDDDEYVAFETKNPEVIRAFKDFVEGVVKFTMKDIIEKQKAAMEAKKKADEQRKKEEVKAKKESKLNAFLGESVEDHIQEFETKLRRHFPDLQNFEYHPRENYISLDLGSYTTEGMNELNDIVVDLINNEFASAGWFVVDEDNIDDIYGGEWPDESPFYDEESIFIKVPDYLKENLKKN